MVDLLRTLAVFVNGTDKVSELSGLSVILACTCCGGSDVAGGGGSTFYGGFSVIVIKRVCDTGDDIPLV